MVTRAHISHNLLSVSYLSYATNRILPTLTPSTYIIERFQRVVLVVRSLVCCLVRIPVIHHVVAVRSVSSIVIHAENIVLIAEHF